jgi:uncharacterized protein YkwD
MRRLFPAVALVSLTLVSLSLGGCSALPDVTGAFSSATPRPEAAIAEEGEYMRAATPRRVARGPSPLAAPFDPLANPASEPAQDDNSDIAIAPVPRVKRAPIIQPKNIAAAEPEAPIIPSEPAAESSDIETAKATRPLRVNVASARDQINAYRREQGLPALRIDSALMQAARQQSDAMARNDAMSHTVAGSFGKRMAKVGVEGVPAGENIAAGYSNVGAVIRGWKGSQAHDANLKMAEATRLGIAATPSPSQPQKLYWTLIVAGD